jgi:hypothetical protein
MRFSTTTMKNSMPWYSAAKIHFLLQLTPFDVRWRNVTSIFTQIDINWQIFFWQRLLWNDVKWFKIMYELMNFHNFLHESLLFVCPKVKHKPVITVFSEIMEKQKDKNNNRVKKGRNSSNDIILHNSTPFTYQFSSKKICQLIPIYVNWRRKSEFWQNCLIFLVVLKFYKTSDQAENQKIEKLNN